MSDGMSVTKKFAPMPRPH